MMFPVTATGHGADVWLRSALYDEQSNDKESARIPLQAPAAPKDIKSTVFKGQNELKSYSESDIVMAGFSRLKHK